MRYRKFRRLITFLLLAALFVLPLSVRAAEEKDQDTGYRILVDDQADLLTDEEEARLIEDMKPAAKFGHIGFLSIDKNDSSTPDFARSYYIGTFGKENGTLFLIDMDNRKIYIFSGGTNYKVIGKSRADVITDNIYTYASKGAYYDCASRAFSQIATLLEGGRISEPMRYIGNALLALILALLINFVIVNSISRVKRVRNAELISVAERSFSIGTPQAVYTGETKRYDPVETSSGGGGGGGGGGGR